MKYLQYLAAILAVAPSVLAAPKPERDGNPYLGVQPYANKGYAAKLEETIKYFNKEKDYINAARTRSVQKVPTFGWVSNSAAVRMVFPLKTEQFHSWVLLLL
jgi:cellulose 1,4-beta-cellobiosidase